VTEFLYIKNENWGSFEEWKPFHLKNNEDYYLFDENKFDLMSNDYINRFGILIINKILTYD